MMTILNLVLVVLLLSFIPIAFMAVRAYFRYRGTRVITCPETKMPAAVRVDKGHVAATTASGEPELRLESCSRWPEKEHCGQECLSQIAEAPEACLVRNMLVHWYAGASCALCNKAIGPVLWSEHKPALLTPDRKTIEWDDIPPETLPTVMATHKRVCWNCHVANTFRDQFPGLAVDRPAPPVRRAS
jgi:hypothetical protein